MFKLLVAFSLYLPFQIALNPTRNVDLASVRVFILALFLIWAAEGLSKKKLVVGNNLQTVFLSSFLFLNTLSLFQARNVDWSARKLLFLFSIFPVYFVVSDVIRDNKKMLAIIKGLVWSGVGAALIGIFQFTLQFIAGMDTTYNFWADHIAVPFLGKNFAEAVLANPSWLVNVAGNTYLRATATFPDPHMFSFFLGLLIPLALGLFLETKKNIYFIFLAVLFLADILTFSRGGYLGLFLGAVVLVVLFWKEIGKRYKLTAAGIISLLIVVLAIPSPISQRFFSSFNLKEGSNKGRIETWNKALKVAENNFLTGVGIGNYPLEIKSTADYREPIYAHNTYLDIAVETGAPNALVWLSLLLLAAITCIKRKQAMFLCLSVSIVIFAAHSMVETAIYSPVVLSLLLIIISFSNIETNHGQAV